MPSMAPTSSLAFSMLNSSISQAKMFSTLTRNFGISAKDVETGENVVKMDKMIYEYRMKMKLVAKEATKMVVKDEDLEQMAQPEFLGKIGVNMQELEYWVVKESARTPSKYSS